MNAFLAAGRLNRGFFYPLQTSVYSL